MSDEGKKMKCLIAAALVGFCLLLLLFSAGCEVEVDDDDEVCFTVPPEFFCNDHGFTIFADGILLRPGECLQLNQEEFFCELI